MKVAIIALALLVSIAWMWNPGHAPRFDIADTGYYSFHDEVYGAAPKGICYRVFAPYLCRLANEEMPQVANWALARIVAVRPFNEMSWDKLMLRAYFMAGLLALGSFLVLGLTSGWMALLLAWAAIGPHGGVGDPVTLAAFGLAFWALRNDRSRWFWVAFAVAALNRETAPLMLIWWVMSGGRVKTAVLAMVAWVALRGILAEVYAGNSLEMCWPMLERNLKMIQPLSMTTLLAGLGGSALLCGGLKSLPSWVPVSYVVGLVLLVGMAVLWSRPERMRTYLELLPMAAVAMNGGFRSFVSLLEVKR